MPDMVLDIEKESPLRDNKITAIVPAIIAIPNCRFIAADIITASNTNAFRLRSAAGFTGSIVCKDISV